MMRVETWAFTLQQIRTATPAIMSPFIKQEEAQLAKEARMESQSRQQRVMKKREERLTS